MSRFRPSPALVVATIALFVSLGGFGYAATKIGTKNIKNGAVTAKKLHKNAVTTKKIKSGAVTAGKIRNGAVGTDKLAGQAVTSGKLADGAVGTSKLVDQAVTSGKLADGAVGTDKLADQAVTTGKLGDASVSTDKLADASVTTSKLVDQAVSREKLADRAVGTDKIALDAHGVAQAAVNVDGATGTVRSFFNRLGGAPTVARTAPGTYSITIPGLAPADATKLIHVATPSRILGDRNATVFVSGTNPAVRTTDLAATPADSNFIYVLYEQLP